MPCGAWASCSGALAVEWIAIWLLRRPRAALEAYVFCRLVLCLVRLLVAPRYPRLRLVRISDEGARFAVRLTR